MDFNTRLYEINYDVQGRFKNRFSSMQTSLIYTVI